MSKFQKFVFWKERPYWVFHTRILTLYNSITELILDIHFFQHQCPENRVRGNCVVTIVDGRKQFIWHQSSPISNNVRSFGFLGSCIITMVCWCSVWTIPVWADWKTERSTKTKQCRVVLHIFVHCCKRCGTFWMLRIFSATDWTLHPGHTIRWCGSLFRVL